MINQFHWFQIFLTHLHTTKLFRVNTISFFWKQNNLYAYSFRKYFESRIVLNFHSSVDWIAVLSAGSSVEVSGSVTKYFLGYNWFNALNPSLGSNSKQVVWMKNESFKQKMKRSNQNWKVRLKNGTLKMQIVHLTF